jgi:transposase
MTLRHFALLKSVLEVSPIFLKKPERIEAMMFLFFIALMIVNVQERNIRGSMTEALPLKPSVLKTQTPTWENIRYFFRNYFFRNVHQIVVIKGRLVLKTCLKGMTKIHKQLLKLLKIPISVYKKLDERWWEFGST